MEFAFVPVDPRLGDSFYKAGEYFIETFHPKGPNSHAFSR